MDREFKRNICDIIKNKFDIVNEKIRCNFNLYCYFIVEYN